MAGVRAVDKIRAMHVASLVKYLTEQRQGLHVTDLVYGCPYYAKWALQARADGELGERKNIDEGGLIRLSVGKLLDSLSLGGWHHVDLRYGELVGQIDDIVFVDGVLYVVDKKTLAEKPPREVHSHYQRQVQTYIYMLKYGEIVGCEVGGLDELRKMVSSGVEIKGAILYVDVSASTKTQVSDVIEVQYDDEVVSEWVEWMLAEVEKERPEKVVSWFCHYCPIMNRCWGEGFG